MGFILAKNVVLYNWLLKESRSLSLLECVKINGKLKSIMLQIYAQIIAPFTHNNMKIPGYKQFYVTKGKLAR